MGKGLEGTACPLRALEGTACTLTFSRRSSEEERLNTRHLTTMTLTSVRLRRWLSAHNGEDVGSKPTAGTHF